MDARVCVIKYFIAASEAIEFLVFLIKGIIAKRLISNPSHILIQEYDEIEMIVPNIKVNIKIILFREIKKKRIRTFMIGVWTQ